MRKRETLIAIYALYARILHPPFNCFHPCLFYESEIPYYESTIIIQTRRSYSLHLPLLSPLNPTRGLIGEITCRLRNLKIACKRKLGIIPSFSTFTLLHYFLSFRLQHEDAKWWTKILPLSLLYAYVHQSDVCAFFPLSFIVAVLDFFFLFFRFYYYFGEANLVSDRLVCEKTRECKVVRYLWIYTNNFILCFFFKFFVINRTIFRTRSADISRDPTSDKSKLYAASFFIF